MAAQRQQQRLAALVAAAIGVTQAAKVLSSLDGAEATLLAQVTRISRRREANVRWSFFLNIAPPSFLL
jgi:hypothetical protein